MGGIYEGCRIVRGTEREPSRENRKDFGSVTSIFSGRVISHLSLCLPIRDADSWRSEVNSSCRYRFLNSQTTASG
jgi:hypothetical protein